MDGSLWPPPRFDERGSEPAAFNDSTPTGTRIAVAVAGVTQLAIVVLLAVLALRGADCHIPGWFMID